MRPVSGEIPPYASSALARVAAGAPDLLELVPNVFTRRLVRHAEEGGTTDEDDDGRNDWCGDIQERIRQADAAVMNLDMGMYRERLLRVAELALAAIAAHDRLARRP